MSYLKSRACLIRVYECIYITFRSLFFFYTSINSLDFLTINIYLIKNFRRNQLVMHQTVSFKTEISQNLDFTKSYTEKNYHIFKHGLLKTDKRSIAHADCGSSTS
jgi:hypothetical protein